LVLDAAVLSRDGSLRLVANGEGNYSESVELGMRVAQELLAQGAAALIADSRAAG
jgi:porphobilinogen deaminase